MPFTELLREIVSTVEGAEGAIFVEADGEAVQWYAKAGAERLQLRAAYLAVVLKACRASSSRLALGKVKHLILDYDGTRLVVEDIGEGYFVVLELSASANIGQALYRIQPAVARLRREINR